MKQSLQTAYAEVVLQRPLRINRRLGVSVLALVIVSLVLGFLLARFNVFAALVATALCAVSCFIYTVTSDFTLGYSLLTSLATALALQVGYLVSQFLWRPRK
jgi:hypothetical protein